MTCQDERAAAVIETLRARGYASADIVEPVRLRDVQERALAPSAHSSDVWVALDPSEMARYGTVSTRRIVIDTDGEITWQGVYVSRSGKRDADAVAGMDEHAAACVDRCAAL